MPATYAYRAGAVPTAIDAVSEITRNVGTASASRLKAAGIKLIVAEVGVNLDTSADAYDFILSLEGDAIQGSVRMPFAAMGQTTATIASTSMVTPPFQQDIDVQLDATKDFGTFLVQHGSTVALGNGSIGLALV
jgi:hypothetical protein